VEDRNRVRENDMVERSAEKQLVPADLADAFSEAVGLYPDYDPALREQAQLISLNRKPYSICAVCRLTGIFSDPLPEDVLDQLFSYLRPAEYMELAGSLAKHPTYEIASKCLLKLIEDKRTRYQQSEARRCDQ